MEEKEEKKEFKIGLGSAVLLFFLGLILIVGFVVFLLKTNIDNGKLRTTTGMRIESVIQHPIA